MRPIALIAMSSAALALGACSQEPEAPSAMETSEPAVEETAEAAPEPVASDIDRPVELVAQDAVPDAMHGRWGLVALDCTSTLGDAKGLMTVGPRDIKFYESVAKIGMVNGATRNHIRAAFTFSGEGQTWTQDVVLDLREDGKTLVRRDYGPDAVPGPLEYTRCQ